MVLCVPHSSWACSTLSNPSLGLDVYLAEHGLWILGQVGSSLQYVMGVGGNLKLVMVSQCASHNYRAEGETLALSLHLNLLATCSWCAALRKVTTPAQGVLPACLNQTGSKCPSPESQTERSQTDGDPQLSRRRDFVETLRLVSKFASRWLAVKMANQRTSPNPNFSRMMCDGTKRGGGGTQDRYNWVSVRGSLALSHAAEDGLVQASVLF
jgi:hypothetical protein